MSSNNDNYSSESKVDEVDIEVLEGRIRDLEVSVFGYDPGQSAGDEAVVDVKRTVVFLENRYAPREEYDGVPVEDVYAITEVIGLSREVVEQAYEKLRRQGEVYEPAIDEVRST